MIRGRSAWTIVAMIVGPVLSPTPISGQQDMGPRTPLIEARIAHIRHGNGKEAECTRSTGYAAGLAVSTPGALLISLNGDVLVSGGTVCITPLPLVEYQGETLEVWGFTAYRFEPRLLVELGYRFSLNGHQVEPSLGAGLLRTTTEFGFHGVLEPGEVGYPEEVTRWEPWYGGSVAVRPRGRSFALELELGEHKTFKRYYRENDPQHVVEFTLPRTFLRAGVTVPLRH